MQRSAQMPAGATFLMMDLFLSGGVMSFLQQHWNLISRGKELTLKYRRFKNDQL